MRRSLVIVGVLVVLGLGVRASLPELAKRYLIRVIDETENLDGRIEDVDLSLWRGAATIRGLRLDHEEKQELRPLLAADSIDASIQWSALLEGELVGEIDVDGLVYNLVAAPPEDDAVLAQEGEEFELAERLLELFPFSINELEVRNADIHYRDPHRSPPVDIAIRDAHLLATNWSNVTERNERHYGRAWLRARAFDSARLTASLEANPLASPPEFQLALVTERIDLTQLNDFLRAYGGFDAQRGRLSVYAELAAADGRFDGYVKPVVSELDILGPEEDDDWLDRVWEGTVGAVAEIFENQPSGRQATRIPIEGRWAEPAPDLVSAIGSVVYNAFVEALPPRLENPGELAR